MPLDQKAILDQIDSALERYSQARSYSKYDDLSDLPESEGAEVTLRLAAVIGRIAPVGSAFQEDAQAILRGSQNYIFTVQPLLGILKALRTDYKAGHLQAVHELIHADVFSDFLEMADYLLGEGYKDPAAVLAGGVLEEQLRKLCQKNGIEVEKSGRAKKADTLNSELAKEKVYERLDQKSVTAWLDLRNNAAHGKYDEYTKEQVALMVQGIRDFIVRHPA